MQAQEIHNAEDHVSGLRNEPVQARSTARLTALLDAAAVVVDEIGFERLTTAMVAERAGASIGTVYRYFPDRIALLQALAARNMTRILARVSEEISDERHATWGDATSAAFDAFIEAYRSEPSFRGLRYGDVLDLRPAANEHTFNSIIANRLLDNIQSRFGFADGPEVRFAFETAIEVSDALSTRAFARDPQGDPAFLKAAHDLAVGILEPHMKA
ncbi:TetR/AcrR family transcriptional regulator [Salinibacterium sp. G-O1]|uniref:TetR/AcrR family transcriptional regulator n=1 Tax=Salinibacterium sp. G-O1 TaxID=3046208 RepID=UPI0024B99059|nr:TetR/AcrR family transcriptional regulator [Salinibacterium sp. G-O1]MDJ0335452.1 TetR/AcrR family transcriptional regulator [Salinibacterium sp. G-O1]